MRKFFLPCFLLLGIISTSAQDAAKRARALTMQEYDKAKTYAIKDLDKDTYAKFDNAYIFDRYEMRKPYFITGDDGNKKRIDLYKLISKDSMQELGTAIYYTNEKGKRYMALQPNFIAAGNVWEKYFEDIHAIDKEEKNFVLKLSYILSKEMSFQLYKAINSGSTAMDDGTYGTDICFPGTDLVSMADGSKKELKSIVPGDRVITVDPATKKASVVHVKELQAHDESNYAITKLLLMSSVEKRTSTGTEILLKAKVLETTPNHPLLAGEIRKEARAVAIGDQIICQDKPNGRLETFTVFNKTEAAAGKQKVYNMVVSGGTTFIMNDVMVMQK
jgi:hypothetical protein